MRELQLELLNQIAWQTIRHTDSIFLEDNTVKNV